MIKVKKSTLKALLTGAFILQAGHGSFQSFIQIEVLRQPENILAANFYSSLLVKTKWMGGDNLKVSKNLKLLTTTQSEMANIMGVSQQRVSQLISENVILRDKNNSVLVIESLKNYYKLKANAENSDDIDFQKERALHEKTKREIAELKLAKMQRSAYDARTVELVLTEMLSNLRTQLLGLPSKLAPILEDLKKEKIYGILSKEIEEKLLELSEYDPEMFAADEIDEGEDDEDSS